MRWLEQGLLSVAMPSLVCPNSPPPASEPSLLEADEALTTLHSVLFESEAAAADPSLLRRIELARGEAARAIGGLLRGQLSARLAERVLTLSAALRTAGIFDGQPTIVSDETATTIHGPGRILAQMLRGAGWQSPLAPLLEDVPDAWWGRYVAWLFAAPKKFVQVGDADRFAAHFLRHAEELARWAERNPGSAAVHAAVESYLATRSAPLLLVSGDSLKRHAEAHGRILAVAGGSRAKVLRTAAPQGRRLRLAFVASHPSVLPVCRRSLDAQRFEVTTYALEGVEGEQGGEDAGIAVSAILSLLRSDLGSQSCRQLPAGLADQVAELARGEPDVIVYGEELALATGALAQLAVQRIAPLQVLLAPGGVTSGLASIDLFVIGDAAFDPALTKQFSERLAVWPGPGHVFTEISAAEVSAERSRAALPLPEKACVVMTAIRLDELTPEKMQAWAALLQEVAGVTLGIQLLNSAEVPFAAIEACGAEWDACLASVGVSPDRGLILASPIGSLADLQSVLAAADIYLDGASSGEPDLLHVPLGLGIPLVAVAGPTGRTRFGAALLRSLDRGDCVARDDQHLREIVARLADDPAHRAEIAAGVRSMMERLPACRDSLAAAEALGSGLEQAYGELHALGARKFRAAGPLRPTDPTTGDRTEKLRLGAAALAVDEPAVALARAREILATRTADPDARRLAGRALIAEGRYAVAVEYLLAVVQVIDDADVWFDLAVALHRNGQTKEALQALETSLRRDDRRADAWVMLIELASAVGADDTAREGLAALRTCAPDDGRIPELAASLPKAGSRG